MIKHLTIGAAIVAFVAGPGCAQAPKSVSIRIDVRKDRKPIHPEIYGVSFADAKALADLRCPVNRNGGNATTQYNWKLNADNRGNDWFFDSFGEDDPAPGGRVDNFIKDAKANGAQPMITIPMIGYVGNIGPDRSMRYSFSVKKYGPQQKTDPSHPDAGNGVKPDGANVTGNDPTDANVKADAEFQKGWVEHMVAKWGASKKGGVRYYLLDNEPSLWSSTHRDVHPQGETLDEILNDSVGYASMIKSVDPGALTVGPEEWGYPAYFWSGADQDYGNKNHWPANRPDKDAHGGEDYAPWFLDQMRASSKKAGKRLLDIFTLHYYPQGGEDGSDNSDAIQLKRNRSTRSLWDPSYVDESWINDKVNLIPRMRAWVDAHYPGTKIGITEYNWGGEKSMSGGTVQADILGIFGREGLDVGCRWTCPASGTPEYQAMKIYRNYDGKGGSFGDISVSDVVPNPDDVASFAAVRKSDGALTVIVINKQLHDTAKVDLSLAGFKAKKASAWQIAGGKPIASIGTVDVAGGKLTRMLPAQSITLFVVAGK